MNTKDLFVKYHWAPIMVLLIVVLLGVCWQVILEDTDLFNKKDKGQVKGELVIIDTEKANQAVIKYQNELKEILTKHFTQRVEFDKPHQEWIFLVNNTKYKILTLAVPDEYQELQTQVIIALDEENKAVSQSSQSQLDKANSRWQKILEQYYWLNH